MVARKKAPAKKLDALDALLEKQTQIKIAGLDFKFRFATASERIQWIREFPQGTGEEDPIKQSLAVQDVIAKVLSALHIPSATARKRTNDEWMNLMAFADADARSDYGVSQSLVDYGLSLMGVANRQDDDKEVDRVGSNPT